MKKQARKSTPPLPEGESLVPYGPLMDLEAQISFALSSVRVVADVLGTARYGTCQSVEDNEAAGEVLHRALWFLDDLDLSRVTMKPHTDEKP